MIRSSFSKGGNLVKSLKNLYRIGVGPSSSHTIGPQRICTQFLERHAKAERYRVTLYGSLAKTGKGHGTDVTVKNVFSGREIELVSDEETQVEFPNTVDLVAYYPDHCVKERAYSLGGGEISFGTLISDEQDVYPHHTFFEIANDIKERELRFYDYVRECEGDGIFDYLLHVWQTMKRSISEGLQAEGVLPGGLGVERKAKFLYKSKHIGETDSIKEDRMISAYAFAVSEQNASGGTIVTAPTCGSCGVLPSVLKFAQKKHGFSDEQICNALATAGIIGNLIKENASISGAECGCQAEIGSACAMAAAALAELYELDIDQIEYAAEISIEHHLGLTCDPVNGLVQIPCIERNAVAAMRAINAVSLSNFLSTTRKVSFDTIVETMYQTGKDLNCGYRETSQNGLAKFYNNNDEKRS